MKKILLALGGLVLVLALLVGGAMAWLMRDRPAFNAGADGLALSGYDPVAYFPEGGGAPKRGESTYTAEHAGHRYLFASAENRDRFLAAPERYEPEFGGWCAQAVAGGYKFEVDPESHLIVGDRLLLFYRGSLGDARADFEKAGIDASLASADRHWQEMSTP